MALVHRFMQQRATSVGDEQAVERHAGLHEVEGHPPLLVVAVQPGTPVPARERVQDELAFSDGVVRLVGQCLREVGELAVDVDERLLVRAPDVDGRRDGESEDQRDTEGGDAAPQALPRGPAGAHADADSMVVPAGFRAAVPVGLRLYYG